jgi:hypothetical protein
VILYFVLHGLNNNLSSIWADPTASLSSGKMYVGGLGYFNVIKLDNQSVYDWYSSIHAGRGNETLVETDIIDGNVVSRS